MPALYRQEIRRVGHLNMNNPGPTSWNQITTATSGGGGRRRRQAAANSFSCLANVAASATKGMAPYTSGRVYLYSELRCTDVGGDQLRRQRNYLDVHQCVSTGVERDGVAYKEKKQHAGERKAQHAGTGVLQQKPDGPLQGCTQVEVQVAPPRLPPLQQGAL
eukprot:gene24185-biopygen1341